MTSIKEYIRALLTEKYFKNERHCQAYVIHKRNNLYTDVVDI